jgi:uncharacterized Zn-finger protein
MAAVAPTVPHTPIVEIDAQDLPLYCPRPDVPLWNMHPRVFLEIGVTGEAACPYCGTQFLLKTGLDVAGH